MDYLLHIFIIAFIYSIFSISLNLELGYAGLLKRINGIGFIRSLS